MRLKDGKRKDAEQCMDEKEGTTEVVGEGEYEYIIKNEEVLKVQDSVWFVSV